MKSILNFFKNNLKTLIMSVIFAIIIWFAVSIQVFPNVHDHIDGITITAEPTSYMQRENLQITDFQQDITIQILGKRYVIGTLTAEDFTASLDLSEITSPGTHTVDVNVNMVQPNTDYQIISNNLTASVEVERIISKEIALDVNTNSINVADGLQIQTDDISLSTSNVLISGEQSLVNSVARAVIEPLYDGVLTETTKINGIVVIYDADGTKIETNELEYQSDNYTVTIPVYRVKTLPLNVSMIYPQNFNTYSIKYSIFPQEITIAAPADDISIENLERIDVGEIDLTDITYRDLQNSIRLPISLADGYKNLSGIGTAQVTFKDIDSYGRLELPVSTENFTILNGDPSYDYSFVTSQIDITAVGPSDIIKTLSSDDILGTVNLLGTPAELGVKNVTVMIRIAGQNNTAWITGDYKIDIMIKEKVSEEEND
ncbi:MAG: hypothetical protein HDT46_11645 [Ruminococcaceae bacterium]|nr:hypothetical protein [Oscillospiraceae bacterium]